MVDMIVCTRSCRQLACVTGPATYSISSLMRTIEYFFALSKLKRMFWNTNIAKNASINCFKISIVNEYRYTIRVENFATLFVLWQNLIDFSDRIVRHS